MAWTIAIVALSLVMTILAITELRQSIRTNSLRLPDRLFVAATFTVAFIYGLVLLTAKIWL